MTQPDYSSLPPPPPPRSRPQTSTIGWVVILGAGIAVQMLGIWAAWDQVTSLRFDLTDTYGVSVPFPSTGMWQNGLPWFPLIAMPCLVAFAVAVVADRRRGGSLLACVALLVFSTVAVGGGALILTVPEATYRCAACIDPPSFGDGSCDEQFWPPGGDYFDTVPCPADFQDGAERVALAIDRDAIILMAFGGIGVVAGSVLLIRTRRRGARSESLPSGGTTPL